MRQFVHAQASTTVKIENVFLTIIIRLNALVDGNTVVVYSYRPSVSVYAIKQPPTRGPISRSSCPNDVTFRPRFSLRFLQKTSQVKPA